MPPVRYSTKGLITLEVDILSMVITWFGLSSFKISSGNLTLLTDPFGKEVGLTPPRVKSDIAVLSNRENPAYNNQESLGGTDTFVVNGPGEFDVKGLFVRGISASGEPKNKTNGFDHTTIYAIRMEDINLGFLGSLKQKELSDTQLQELGEVDILFVPCGGGSVCDAEEAVQIVSQVEPAVVIPMHFDQKGLRLRLDKIDVFLKEIGSKTEAVEKFTTK